MTCRELQESPKVATAFLLEPTMTRGPESRWPPAPKAIGVLLARKAKRHHHPEIGTATMMRSPGASVAFVCAGEAASALR